MRPGLCLLTPDAGLLSQQVNYRGVNLYSGQAYFGDYNQNVRGLDSVFTNPAGLAGTSTIPNLNKGKMSSLWWLACLVIKRRVIMLVLLNKKNLTRDLL